MLRPLSNTSYARLFATQVIALLGTSLTTVALALLAYDLAGGAAGQVLGTALAIKMVAYATLAPIAGSLAQFLPRRGFLNALALQTFNGLTEPLPHLLGNMAKFRVLNRLH